MNPTVSVIIPTYNYARFIGEAIESVLAQTYPIAEIIIIDDGSTDETEDVVAEFGEKVRYIKQENSSVSVARNNGAKNASGDFLAFLDADDAWLPEKIEKQIAKFREDEQIGLVHCGMREFDSETRETLRLHLEEGEEGWVADDLLLVDRPVIIGRGGAIVVSREAFETVGGFDTEFLQPGSEDWDFCYRIARKYKVGFVPEILVDYRNHGGNYTKDAKVMEHSMKLYLEKAFKTNDKNILQLRRKSYGNLYMEIAAIYLRAGDYGQFGKHLLKSLWFTPGNYSRLMKFPLRWLKRRQMKGQTIEEM